MTGAPPRASDSTRFPIATGALAGALAGLAVGLVDGTRAAWLYGAGLRGGVATALLAAAVDGLAGLAGGAAAELGVRLGVWGWRATAPRLARALAFAAAGLLAAGAAAAVVVTTADRNNRFLAAGLAALAGVAVGALGALLAPALARALAWRRAARRPGAGPAPGVLFVAPAVAAALGVAIFLTLHRTRAPLRGALLTRHALEAAIPACVIPWAIARAARLRLGLRWGSTVIAAIATYGALGAALIVPNWTSNLRFAPWTDITVGAAVALVAIGLLLGVAGRWQPRRGRTAAAAGVLLVAAAALLLQASESEVARKAAGARAALVGPVLAVGRQLFDFDHDGYARFFGGGDCDDGDPAIHPEALDLPGDGIDADCDGQDAVSVLPPPAAMAPLPPSVPPDLDLVFITIDTLRADHLGCYGYARPTSPAIDALAAGGALFDNGWAHAPSTRYSMPALATGRWPSAIDWDESIWWPRIGPGMRTLGQALHDTGYFTAGFFSYTYFAAADRRGFERGMDLYSDARAVLHVAVNGPMESRGSSSREMADDAIAFLEAHKDRKFFLWLHFYDPHLSYEPHPEVPSFGSGRMDLYDGEIRFTDLHLGRVLAKLKELGLWGRTAVVLTGDHGEGFGEHGITEHGFDLYQAQTKVPFIVRVPGLPPRRLAVPAGHIDVAPTLLNLARGRAEPGFIGRSLVPELAGAAPASQPGRWVFQEVTSERGKKRALVTEGRHLIWNWVPDNTTECYDRARDPAEARDLWGRGDAACGALKAELGRLVAGLALPAGAVEKMARGVTPPGAPAPAPSHAVGGLVGDQFELGGYDLEPATVRPGSEVVVTYHFGVRKRIDNRWRLFFHLEGPAGYRNIDHVPVEGLMPLERWRPGQHIRDRQRIFIPVGTPPGSYTIYLGAYRAGGSERLHVTPPALTDGKDRLRVGTFVVR
jgi:arylsulfatase A-like enzyme